MRSRLPNLVLVVFLFYGCVSTKPPAPAPSDVMEGVASWYGQEFAGRTTANGEIFDPLLLTAAHRTLPFGTVLDVRNPKTQQTVRVRVNDRGPYVGNRVIDLSYAAAREIGLVEPGIGDVTITVVRLGRGDREPPAPFTVALDPPAKTEEPTKAGDPPSIAFPLPGQVNRPGAAASGGEVVVDGIEVREQRSGVVTRRQVARDGLTIEDVPVEGAEAVAPTVATRTPAPAARSAPSAPQQSRRFFVQVGAFSSEANASALQAKLSELGHTATVDHHELHRVRIGPFTTRDEALRTRTALEDQGISAIIVAE